MKHYTVGVTVQLKPEGSWVHLGITNDTGLPLTVHLTAEQARDLARRLRLAANQVTQ